jgi:two-component system NtrC family sensor kinase
VMLIAWLFVQRGIVRRLKALSATMLSIADGHLDDPIPLAKSDDEITDMAHALAVFRENAVKRQQAEQSLRIAKERAEAALTDLKAAQRRLVQSEKMASLGQLTAGIAHEIKNPLNFVNNFASLSRELIDELREQLRGVHDRVGPEASQEIEEIFGDLDLNLDKIGEHGKRADGIVRGMLDHSRESSHALEATDINKLIEEYANLAYHGMRAQSTDFNVTIERDLAPDLQPIEVVTQDIGRVILNIITNAFQAIYQKSQDRGHDYDPKLVLSTARHGDKVEIRIRDNGPGMSDEVQAKIFQPFFTTKPTGEGTGLGLSISYDIVVQQHGGRLEVTATKGEGSDFLIVLPAGPVPAAQRTLHEQRT